MNNNFFDSTSSNQNVNNQNTYGGSSYPPYSNDSFSNNDYTPYNNTNNGYINNFSNDFPNSAYSGYAESQNDYAQNQPIANNSYGGYVDNNTYSGYSQNNSYQNQYGYSNPNSSNAYNQSNSYNDNSYVVNNGYPNNCYDNNQRLYNKQNIESNGYNYLDSSDPAGAEVVYAKEKTGSLFGDIVLILIFLAFIAMPVTGIFFEGLSFNLYLSKLMPMFFMGIFLALSIYSTIFPIFRVKSKRKRCKHLLNAKIVDIRVTRGSKGRRYYRPTYKYYYAGKIYIVSAQSGRGTRYLTVGSELPMFINTEDPTDYFIESKGSDTISLVFGIIFTLFLLGMTIPMILGVIFT